MVTVSSSNVAMYSGVAGDRSAFSIDDIVSVGRSRLGLLKVWEIAGVCLLRLVGQPAQVLFDRFHPAGAGAVECDAAFPV